MALVVFYWYADFVLVMVDLEVLGNPGPYTASYKRYMPFFDYKLKDIIGAFLLVPYLFFLFKTRERKWTFFWVLMLIPIVLYYVLLALFLYFVPFPLEFD